MDLHGKIINLQVEKRKQNLAIDEALKSHKNLRDIMVAIYTRAHRDARHAAAELAAEQSVQEADEGLRIAEANSENYLRWKKGELPQQ